METVMDEADQAARKTGPPLAGYCQRADSCRPLQMPRAGAAALGIVLWALASCGTPQSTSDRTGTVDHVGSSLLDNTDAATGAERATASGSKSGGQNDPGSSFEHGSVVDPDTIESAPQVGAKSPEAAAQGYMGAIVRGDFESAARWVTPEQQGIVQALGMGRGPGTLPTMTGHVRVGTVVSAGETTASVTFTGEMCRTAPADGSATPEPECVANQDPDTDLPYFIVHVLETPGHEWAVYFPNPES